MALYIRNQGNVLLEYVSQAEMRLTVKTKFSSLLRAWTHLEYSFIQNNLSQIGGKFEFWGDINWGLSHTNAQHEQKEMVLYETQQNRAGRKKENADFAKGIQKKNLLCNQCSKQE